MIKFFIFLTLFISEAAFAQQAPAPAPTHPSPALDLQPPALLHDGPSVEAKILKPSSSHVTTVPTFGAFLPAQCDGAGNLYFHLNRGNASYNQGVVMKLELDSETPTLFEVHSNLEGKTEFAEFYVTPSGEVWFLIQTEEGLNVVSFDSDGTIRKKVLLSQSLHLDPQNFAVSERGIALVSGYYDSHASEQLQGKSTAALFDTSGRLLRDLRDGTLASVDLSTITRSLTDRGMSVGPDGNFYFLRSDEILVISETGELVRKISVTRPQPHAIARQIVLSDGLISIAFRKPTVEGKVIPEYLVLDAATGSEFGLYEPASEMGNNNICFSRRNGFEFFRVEQGYLKLVTAALR